MTGEGRRQATDFKEAVRCPSAIIQQKALQKTVCAREVPGVTGTLEEANSHFEPTHMESGIETPR